jgi:hypothetical protein
MAGWEAYSVGSVPDLTGRIFVADGGVDGKVELSVEQAQKLPDASLLKAGLNVLQYKWKDFSCGDAQKRLSSLTKTPNVSCWRQVSTTLGRAPERYLLFTNLDLTSQEKLQLKRSILGDAFSEELSFRVSIIAAAEIAAFCNGHRVLTAGFFEGSVGVSYEVYRAKHFSECRLPLESPFVNRERDVAELQDLLRDDGARVLLIEGPRGSGKTRLALEVLLPWRRNGLVIILGSDVRPSILSELECSSPCVVLLEEPEPSLVEAWVKAALGSRETKLVITTKSPEDITLGYLVADDRVLRYRTKPFSETERWLFVSQLGPALDPVFQGFVAAQVGESLSTLVLAIRLGRKCKTELAAELGKDLAGEAKRTLSRDEFALLQRLSLVTYARSLDEAKTLCRLDDQSVTLSNLDLEALEGRLWIQQSAGVITVVPHLLGDYLAQKADPKLVEKALGRLPASLLGRLLERLARGNGHGLWDRILVPEQATTSQLRDKIRYLRLASKSNRDIAARYLKGVWATSSLEQLRAMDWDTRRGLTSVFKSLLRHRTTCGDAMEWLAVLVSAGQPDGQPTANEGKLLTDLLCPLCPAYAVDQEIRLQVVERLLGRNDAGINRTVLDSLLAALERRSADVLLPLASGVDTPGVWELKNQRHEKPSLLSAHAETVADISQRLELTDRDRDRILNIFADLEVDLGPKSVELFGEILERSIERPSPPSEAIVGRLLERYREKLAKNVVSKLESYLKPQEPAAVMQRMLDRCPLVAQTQNADGSITFSAAQLQFNAAELQLLEAFIKNPETFPDQVFQELLDAQFPGAPRILEQLGQLDEDQRLLAHFKRVATARKVPLQAIAIYLRQRSIEPQVLADMSESMTSAEQAMFLSKLHPVGSVFDFTLHALAAYTEFRDQFARSLRYSIWNDAQDVDWVRLLRVLAGPKGEQAAHAVEFAAGLVGLEGFLEDESFRADVAGWLEIGIPQGVYEWDRVAVMLARRDSGLAFEVLGQLLTSPDKTSSGSPLSIRNGFWSTLLEADFNRSLDIVYAAYRQWDDPSGLGFRLPASVENLIGWMASDEERAQFVVAYLGSIGDQALWSMATAIIKKWPPPCELARQLGDMLLQPTVPSEFRTQWLESLNGVDATWKKSLLEDGEVGSKMVWEYKLDSREFLALLDSPTDRQWVQERILRELPWAEASKHISLEDLKRLLPNVSLPDRKKRALTTALQFWTRNAV